MIHSDRFMDSSKVWRK